MNALKNKACSAVWTGDRKASTDLMKDLIIG